MGMVGLRDVFVVAQPSFHHHQMTDHHQLNSQNPATALGVGVIPLLTAAPCLAPQNVDDKLGGINLWQNQVAPHQNYLKNRSSSVNHDSNVNSSINYAQPAGGGGGSSGGGGGGSGSSSNATCQDCGNQAKKDCRHRRCRTCCRSRGFDCTTHVKSTWVPASRRRERQLMSVTGTTFTAAGAGSSTSTSGTKKPRLVTSQTTTTSHTSTSNTTPPRSFDTSSSHQDAGFRDGLPAQVQAPAVFRCVKVTGLEDGEDEYVYQAVVKIGGHVWKGFLYNQGVEPRDHAFPNISELHLGGGGGRNVASSSSPMLDPSDVYAATGGGLLGGSSYELVIPNHVTHS